MTDDEIRRLLSGFYDGSLSEEEEERLKEALCRDVPYVRPNERIGGCSPPTNGGARRGLTWGASLHETDKRLFCSLFANETTEADVPEGMEERLSRLIDERAKAENRLFLSDKAQRALRWIGGIAATVLLLIGIGFGTLFPQQDTPKDTFTDPQEAYLALLSTLKEVSACMNEGLAQVREVETDFKEINQEIRNELKN